MGGRSAEAPGEYPETRHKARGPLIPGAMDLASCRARRRPRSRDRSRRRWAHKRAERVGAPPSAGGARCPGRPSGPAATLVEDLGGRRHRRRRSRRCIAMSPGYDAISPPWVRKSSSPRAAPIASPCRRWRWTAPTSSTTCIAGQRRWRTTNPSSRGGTSRRPVSWWRGEAYADVADVPFAAAERIRLDELCALAHERRLDAGLRLGRGASLVADIEARLLLDPLRERLWEQLMVALYRADRQADALAAFRRARAVLVEGLGISRPATAASRAAGAGPGREPSGRAGRRRRDRFCAGVGRAGSGLPIPGASRIRGGRQPLVRRP